MESAEVPDPLPTTQHEEASDIALCVYWYFRWIRASLVGAWDQGVQDSVLGLKAVTDHIWPYWADAFEAAKAEAAKAEAAKAV